MKRNKKENYEVRVREKIGEDKWIKKSKFYYVTSSEEAVQRYQDQCKRRHIPSGHIMWAAKISDEKIHEVGEFFKLGSQLLKEFSEQGIIKGDNNGTNKETTNGYRKDGREWRRDSREENWA